MLQVEYDFELPKGFVDATGTVQKKGIIRLATAADEIMPLKDPRVIQNPAFLTVIILSRVIVRLGTLDVNPQIIEGLFAVDFNYLQSLYQEINAQNPPPEITCPHCGKEHAIPMEVRPLLKPGQ